MKFNAVSLSAYEQKIMGQLTDLGVDEKTAYDLIIVAIPVYEMLQKKGIMGFGLGNPEIAQVNGGTLTKAGAMVW